MAIVHNDVAELGWNIFSNELNEDIDTFILYLHIPGNKEELRAWAHGPLNGNIELIDKETVKVTIDDLNSNTAMDVRVVFDKTVLSNSLKQTKVDALSKILVYEEAMAKKANAERERSLVIQKMHYVSLVISVIWIIGLIFLVIRTYLKYDKEYQPEFTGKYYREFPDESALEIVGYLMNKKVSVDDLSAAILNLIYKKIIKVEEIRYEKGNKDYNFIYQREAIVNVSLREQVLIDWLFDNPNNRPNEIAQITMSKFKNDAKSGSKLFIDYFNKWETSALEEGMAMNFHQNSKKGKKSLIFYAILGFILASLGIQAELYMISPIMVIASIATIVYALSISKRTKKGSEAYAKWRGLKNFLEDFGNFSEKELPEIVLWEKYLVYAVTLGCAEKLAKTMAIKIQQFYPNDTSDYGYHYSDTILLNYVINDCIHNAVYIAFSPGETHSKDSSSDGGFGDGFSSGEGFGGGFSSNGGSFGGGSGGGRF